ncbi:Uncharacterised protein [Mycobacteroides abscessus subsp. abscessus]|nr:Uncharacterised protein [Mycobacteroides abscessus subsp. abscessus]
MIANPRKPIITAATVSMVSRFFQLQAAEEGCDGAASFGECRTSCADSPAGRFSYFGA